MELERSLERRIASEEYEAAASVRDQIREIEGILDTEGGDGEAE
jgi:protein-arginine kinase activator protein McsA